MSTWAINEEESVSGLADANDKKKGDDATTLPYYVMFGMGLGGNNDLEIDSAFGELSL